MPSNSKNYKETIATSNGVELQVRCARSPLNDDILIFAQDRHYNVIMVQLNPDEVESLKRMLDEAVNSKKETV